MKLKEMRALTITQPWAECMLSQGKNVENRSWNTHQRGYIAIHASSSFRADSFKHCENSFGVEINPDEVDYGAIIAFAKLIDVVKEEDLTKDTKKWFEGEYGFVFDDVIRLKYPINVKGSLGFWKLRGKSLDQCLSQLNAAQIKKLSQLSTN